MIRDLVNYDTALELNGLGFNEPCFCIYNRERKLRFNNLHNPHDRDKGVKLTSNSGRYPAPTYSQAFRWFREKYNLLGYVSQATISKGKVFMFTCNEGNDTLVEDIDSDFKTYEEAELVCLKNLIEIVKEKK